MFYLFVVKETNLFSESECVYLCVYGLWPICPFGGAHFPPSMKRFTQIGKFDGLGLVLNTVCILSQLESYESYVVDF